MYDYRDCRLIQLFCNGNFWLEVICAQIMAMILHLFIRFLRCLALVEALCQYKVHFTQIIHFLYMEILFCPLQWFPSGFTLFPLVQQIFEETYWKAESHFAITKLQLYSIRPLKINWKFPRNSWPNPFILLPFFLNILIIQTLLQSKEKVCVFFLIILTKWSRELK